MMERVKAQLLSMGRPRPAPRAEARAERRHDAAARRRCCAGPAGRRPAARAGRPALVWQRGGRYVTTENAYVRADIVQIAPEISGRVIEVAVRDHARVAAGDVLLRIDPEPFRLAVGAGRGRAGRRPHPGRDRARHLPRDRRASSASWKPAPTTWRARRGGSRTWPPAAWRRDPAWRRRRTTPHVARERINVVRQRLVRLLTTLKGDPDLPVDEHPTVRERLAERDRAALDLARTTIAAPVGGTIVNMRLATRGAGARRDAGLLAGLRTAPLGGGQPEGNHPDPCRASGRGWRWCSTSTRT